jgi:hypothetical protein
LASRAFWQTRNLTRLKGVRRYSALCQFEAQVLIWLASYPRSGNTLLRLVLEREFAYHTCSLYRERTPETGPELADLVDLTSAKLVANAIDKDEDIHFVKTHELATDDAFPAIYVVRDGRDAMVSFAHFLIDFVIGKSEHDPEVQYWQTLQELLTTTERYGGWSQNVQSWLHRPGTVLVKFEELIDQPVECARDALRRLHIEPRTGRGHEGLVPFEQLQRESPRFFRTGASGNWRTDMDDLLESLFWEQHGATMDELGYARTRSTEVPSVVHG